MAEEKVLVVNIRKAALKTPKWRRSGDAASILRRQIAKATRSGSVSIGANLNAALWKRGAKSPRMRLRVKVSKSGDGSVRAELVE